MTYNAESAFASIVNAPTELYMTGNAFNSWTAWHQLTPVGGSDDQFWTITYLTEGDQFKFSPETGWGGQEFGFPATTINDIAGASLTSSTPDGNFVVGNSGWYLLHVTNGTSKVLEILEPEVYVFGNAIGGKWDFASAPKCEIPTTKDDNFVTPEFTTACDGGNGDTAHGLRLCVKIGNFEWWQSEFIIRDGKVEYRGKDGEQYPRVGVEVGQKAYLNFTDGTGEIK